MARPIQNTPSISGEDALKFRQNLKKVVSELSVPKKGKKKKEALKEMEDSYKLMVSISNGSFF